MQTVRDARASYFAKNGFSDASYRDRWVRFRLGPLPIAFPNTASRRAAVPMHDLPHIATGYETTIVGEAEIGAYEVAAGCGRYLAAWVLNASAFAGGMLLAPRRVYRAFVRGRHARTLYAQGWDDRTLMLTVEELRRELGLDRETPRATWHARIAFAGWLAMFAAPGLAVIALLVHLKL